MLGEYEPALLNSYNARMARKMGLKHYDKEIAVRVSEGWWWWGSKGGSAYLGLKQVGILGSKRLA